MASVGFLPPSENLTWLMMNSNNRYYAILYTTLMVADFHSNVHTFSMLEKDILLIINPNASKGRGRKSAKLIQGIFKERGRQCTVAYTKGAGHASILAKKGVQYEYKVIIAAGGDGTVNEVLNGIMSSGGSANVTMGIIPIGRGNDFAWCAGIPQTLEDAIDLIIKGESRPVDVGICKGTDHPNGMYFLNGTGFGFEPMVNFRAMEYTKLNGTLSYIAAFFYVLRHFPKPYHLSVSIDDGEEFTLDTQQFSVLNGKRMGASFVLGPRASINDGLFDIFYANRPFRARRDLIIAVLEFFRGAHIKDKDRFTYLRAWRVRISSDTPSVIAHSDGELFTKNGRSFFVEILPGALKLIYGKEK